MTKTRNHIWLKIYDLDLFEEYRMWSIYYIRVPWGWVMAKDNSSYWYTCFIPYNEEYIINHLKKC